MLLFRIYALCSLVCIILLTLGNKRLKKDYYQHLNLDFMTLDKNKKKRKLIKTLIKYNIPFNIVLFIFSLYSIYTLYPAINERDIFNELNKIIIIILSVSGLGLACCSLIQNFSLPSFKSSDKSIKKIILGEIFFGAIQLSLVFVMIYFVILICTTFMPIETSFDIYIPNDIIYQYNIDLE